MIIIVGGMEIDVMLYVYIVGKKCVIIVKFGINQVIVKFDKVSFFIFSGLNIFFICYYCCDSVVFNDYIFVKQFIFGSSKNSIRM